MQWLGGCGGLWTTSLAVVSRVHKTSMVGWRCKLKKRLVWMLSLMAVTSVVMVVRVHMSQVRRQKAEFILSILGSRNTSEFVSPLVETVLVDSIAGWVSQRALESYQGLEGLVREKRLQVRDVRAQPKVSRPPFVLIVVMSEFGFQANREAIRQTWYKWARREDAKVVFFLGLPYHVNVTMAEIEKEIRRYKDIIVDDHLDSYYMLSVKVLRVLKWFKSTYPQEKSRPSFLVKTDHDVFNHLPNLVRHLKGVARVPNYIGGLLHTHAPVMRDGYSKWYTPPELWQEEFFPPYVGGPCYILAGNVAPKIYEAALSEKLFHLEDVFLTGIVPAKYFGGALQGVPEDQILQSDKKLRMFDNNVKNSLSFHPVSPAMMHQYYRIARRPIWR